jgi:hypothetical protein
MAVTRPSAVANGDFYRLWTLRGLRRVAACCQPYLFVLPRTAAGSSLDRLGVILFGGGVRTSL